VRRRKLKKAGSLLRNVATIPDFVSGFGTTTATLSGFGTTTATLSGFGTTAATLSGFGTTTEAMTINKGGRDF